MSQDYLCREQGKRLREGSLTVHSRPSERGREPPFDNLLTVSKEGKERSMYGYERMDETCSQHQWVGTTSCSSGRRRPSSRRMLAHRYNSTVGFPQAEPSKPLLSLEVICEGVDGGTSLVPGPEKYLTAALPTCCPRDCPLDCPIAHCPRRYRRSHFGTTCM